MHLFKVLQSIFVEAFERKFCYIILILKKFNLNLMHFKNNLTFLFPNHNNVLGYSTYIREFLL